MKIIEIYVHTDPHSEPRKHAIDEEKTVEVLIREIWPDRHEEIDLFIEGAEVPLERHHRLHDHGIKHGHHIHGRPGRPGITIIVNGTPHGWEKPEISYTEVVTLFDPEYPKHPEVTYSVTYKHGPSRNPEGILPPGDSVEVKNRMIFNVSPTGQS